MENEIAAGIFGKIFTLLAEHPRRNKEIAHQVWDMMSVYELEHFLMGCDDSLIKLGLAKRTDEGYVNYK